MVNSVNEIRLAGVDEAGRGPLAGPVVTAAVILDSDNPVVGLDDSKKLTEKKREYLFEEIKLKAQCYCIARADVEEIDDINIFQATLMAMKRAVEGLSMTPLKVMVDGKFCPKINLPCEAIVKGDARVAAISAASILAKVTRDNEMKALDSLYPGYGFAQNKGYPTRVHIEALQELGVSPVHRRSYKPVQKILHKQ
jgi:ribonuclease HII